jgi:hypothetical protein
MNNQSKPTVIVIVIVTVTVTVTTVRVRGCERSLISL